jgi:hypothetical protein
MEALVSGRQLSVAMESVEQSWVQILQENAAPVLTLVVLVLEELLMELMFVELGLLGSIPPGVRSVVLWLMVQVSLELGQPVPLN